MFTLYQIDFVPTRKAMRKIRNIYPICDSPLKGNVPQDDSQRRFLAQHRVATLFRMVATLFQHCFEWLQHCSNIAALCYAKIVVAYRPVQHHLKRSAWRSFPPKSPFLCVNRCRIWYGFRACAKSIRYLSVCI